MKCFNVSRVAFSDWPAVVAPVFAAMMHGGTLGGSATLTGASPDTVSAGICARGLMSVIRETSAHRPAGHPVSAGRLGPLYFGPLAVGAADTVSPAGGG